MMKKMPFLRRFHCDSRGASALALSGNRFRTGVRSANEARPSNGAIGERRPKSGGGRAEDTTGGREHADEMLPHQACRNHKRISEDHVREPVPNPGGANCETKSLPTTWLGGRNPLVAGCSPDGRHNLLAQARASGCVPEAKFHRQVGDDPFQPVCYPVCRLGLHSIREKAPGPWEPERQWACHRVPGWRLLPFPHGRAGEAAEVPSGGRGGRG